MPDQPRLTPRAALADIRLVLGVAWRLHPRACVLSFVETASRVLRRLLPAFLGLVVGGLASRSVTPLAAGLAGVTAALGGESMLAMIGVHERLRLYELVGHEFDQRTGRLVAAPPTLDHLEDPEYLDRFQIFRDRPGVIGMAFNSIVNCANNLLGPLALVVSATIADWRLLVLAAVAGTTVATTRLRLRWEQEGEEESAAPSRRAEALVGVALDPTGSAELRVFGSRGWLTDRLRDAVRAWWRPQTRATRRIALLDAGIALAYFALAGAVLAWIVDDVARGRVSVTRMTVAVASVSDLAGAAGALAWSAGALAELLRNLARYRALEDYAAAHRATGTTVPPDALTTGIRLRGVELTYPGAAEPALRGVDLDLPAGSVVAVVGENGAGKSTLVTLLTGMYTPARGSLTVDGIPLSDMDIDVWRARCSGAFQDHLRLHDTALSAITVGDLTAVGDERRAMAALEAAAATDVLRALPDGLATRLGPDGGVDLSGGQWQRLAIARGMMRAAPLLLVLDEPTSALDPATEHRLFEGYVAAARAGARRGGITLLVTHRFSTVAAADLVVVLADGRVVEQGTHRELVEAGGRYAELYGLQAAGYR